MLHFFPAGPRWGAAGGWGNDRFRMNGEDGNINLGNLRLRPKANAKAAEEDVQANHKRVKSHPLGRRR